MTSEFQYMMLDRLRSDCKYFLGDGARNTSVLWHKSVDAHIAAMKEFWNAVDEKPTWLTMADIEYFEREMKK